jgi:hypothetical protein
MPSCANPQVLKTSVDGFPICSKSACISGSRSAPLCRRRAGKHHVGNFAAWIFRWTNEGVLQYVLPSSNKVNSSVCHNEFCYQIYLLVMPNSCNPVPDLFDFFQESLDLQKEIVFDVRLFSANIHNWHGWQIFNIHREHNAFLVVIRSVMQLQGIEMVRKRCGCGRLRSAIWLLSMRVSWYVWSLSFLYSSQLYRYRDRPITSCPRLPRQIVSKS